MRSAVAQGADRKGEGNIGYRRDGIDVFDLRRSGRVLEWKIHSSSMVSTSRYCFLLLLISVQVIGNPKIMEILHNEAWFEQEEKKQAEVLEKYWGLNNKFYGQYWIPLAVAKRNSLPLPASRTYGIFTIDEARRLIEDKAPHVIHCSKPFLKYP